MKMVRIILVCLMSFQAVANNTAETKYTCVKGYKAKLREMPDTKSQVLKTVDKFTPLKIIENSQDWFKVSDRMNAIAWVHHSVVSDEIKCAQALNQGTTRISEAVTSSPLDKKPKVFVNETFKIITNSASSVEVEDIHGFKFWLDTYSLWPKGKSEGRIQL